MNCINHYTGLGEVPVTEDAVLLPLTADTTGTWAFMSSFNGAYQYVQFQSIAGQSIVVPAKLNENYTYTFRLYKPDASILNDTYYSMLTVPMLDREINVHTGNAVNTKIGRKQFVAADGQITVSYAELINAKQIVVFVEGAIMQEGIDAYSYTFNSTTGLVTFNTTLQAGQNITLLY
ncbi:MAG: hypothetical protein EOP51_04000, partial [Sphingobacteriales bacterium]